MLKSKKNFQSEKNEKTAKISAFFNHFAEIKEITVIFFGSHSDLFWPRKNAVKKYFFKKNKFLFSIANFSFLQLFDSKLTLILLNMACLFILTVLKHKISK